MGRPLICVYGLPPLRFVCVLGVSVAFLVCIWNMFVFMLIRMLHLVIIMEHTPLISRWVNQHLDADSVGF